MLIFADSFDHYGTNTANMLAGAWAFVGIAVTLSSAQARTGTRSIRMSNNTEGGARVRRVLPGSPRSVVGTGFGVFFESLPTSSDSQGIRFRTSTSTMLSVTFQTDGSLQIFRGVPGGTIIGSTDAGILTASSFQHIEIGVGFDPIVGWVEIRVEGVTIFRIEDVDTGTSGVTVIDYGTVSTAGSPGNAMLWDDIFAWDDTGTVNRDFVGPARVLTLFADADTEVADWSIVGASDGYAAIDEVPPDGDDTHIAASDVGNKSEFTCPELPPEVVGLPAIFVPTMARIEDAGLGRIRVSMIDTENDQVEPGPEQSLTPIYTYRDSTFQVNPETGDIWTKSRFESARIRVEKTL